MAHDVSALVNTVESLASEIAESIQNNDTTMTEHLKSLLDHQYHKDREHLRRKFNQFLTDCFSLSYPENGNNNNNKDSIFKISDKLKPPHNYGNNFTLLLLETKLREMKQQEDDLKLELRDLELNFGRNHDPFLNSLTRTHKLVKYYYLSNSWESAKTVVDSELRVKTMFELRNMIRELMIERRNETAKAEAEGKLSYIDWLSLHQEDEFIELCTIHSHIVQIGKCLCSHLCILMFIVSEDSLLSKKWKILKQVLKLLLQQKQFNVFKKVVFVIEKAEKQIKQIFDPFVDFSDHDDSFSYDQQKYINRVFDMILREVLRLESISSYPSLSLSKLNMKKELRAVMNGVEVCEKNVKKIQSDISFLNKHLVLDNVGDEKAMEEYQTTLRVWIGAQWINLCDEP